MTESVEGFITVVMVPVDQWEPVGTLKVPTDGAKAALEELLGGEFISYLIPDTNAKRSGVMLMNEHAVKTLPGNPRATVFANQLSVTWRSSGFRMHGPVVVCTERSGVYGSASVMITSHLVAATVGAAQSLIARVTA